MFVLPRARTYRRFACADVVDHAFHGSRWAVLGVRFAAAFLLHAVPCAAARGEGAGRERFRRHRYHPEPRAAGRAAMTAADDTRQARRGPLAFALDLWGVLRRPSSVFSLGVLVLAGFVAGVIFWGGFNTALELTNTEAFCTSCHRSEERRVGKECRSRWSQDH